MKTNLLSPDKDPMGAAIADYFNHRKADKLRVFSSQFEEDEIPVNQLFRPYDEMPELEQIAFQIAEGIISIITELTACEYSLLNSKKMKSPLRNYSEVYSPCQFSNALLCKWLREEY